VKELELVVLSYQKEVGALTQQLHTDPNVRLLAPSISVEKEEATADYEPASEDSDTMKQLLSERTTQLQVVMDTLDALHAAGIHSLRGVVDVPNVHAEEWPAFVDSDDGARRHVDDDLFRLASQPLPQSVRQRGPSTSSSSSSSSSSLALSWAIPSLVKRVVELTAELCSMTSSLSLEQRRNMDAERHIQQLIAHTNKLTSQGKAQTSLLHQLNEEARAYAEAVEDAEEELHQDER
jgi:hypothetical protein